MFQRSRRLRACLFPHGVVAATVWGAVVLPAAAQWKGPCGWNDLVEFLDGAPLPDGTGVVAGQVEAFEGGVRYLPQQPGAGSGTQYSGKFFTDVTGDGGATSGHAEVVGRNFYGNTTSVCPGIVDVRCFSSADYAASVLSAGGGPLGSFAPEVANFSYIFTGGGNDELRRTDALINDAPCIAVVGSRNFAVNPVPEGFVSAYNVISVGRSDGRHAAGSTPGTVDGAGRIKPEVVVAHSTTSWATGAASSMTSALYSVAPPAAQRSEVVKAIVMAGATKEEFAAWDKTISRPLDNQYGAGEMNILHSYRILTAGDQAPGVVPRRGWDLLTKGGAGSETYTFTITPEANEAVFSLIATWNRTLSYSPVMGGRYSPDALPDVDLEFRDGSGTLIQESKSSIDNVEHIYFQSLAPDTYTLTVTTDRAVDIGLAWRTELKHAPRVVEPVDPAKTIGMDGLITGVDYKIERTTNLVSWSLRDTVTATGPSMDWADPAPPAADNVFYRIGYIAP